MRTLAFHTYGPLVGFRGPTGFFCQPRDSADYAEQFSKVEKIVVFDALEEARRLPLSVQLVWPIVSDVRVMSCMCSDSIEKTMLALSIKHAFYDGADDVALLAYRNNPMARQSPDYLKAIEGFLASWTMNLLTLDDQWSNIVPAKAMSRDMKTLCILADTERSGIHIRKDELASAPRRIESLMSQCQERIASVTGQSPNLRSSAQVEDLLKRRNISTRFKTALGKMSVRTRHLERFDDDEVVHEILTWRQLEHHRRVTIERIRNGIDSDGFWRMPYDLDENTGEIVPCVDFTLHDCAHEIIRDLLITPVDPICAGELKIDCDGTVVVEYGLDELDAMLKPILQSEDHRKKSMSSVKVNGCINLASGRPIRLKWDEAWKALEVWVAGTRSDLVKDLLVALAESGQSIYHVCPHSIMVRQRHDQPYQVVKDIFMSTLEIETFPVEW